MLTFRFVLYLSWPLTPTHPSSPVGPHSSQQDSLYQKPQSGITWIMSACSFGISCQWLLLLHSVFYMEMRQGLCCPSKPLFSNADARWWQLKLSLPVTHQILQQSYFHCNPHVLLLCRLKTSVLLLFCTSKVSIQFHQSVSVQCFWISQPAPHTVSRLKKKKKKEKFAKAPFTKWPWILIVIFNTSI